MKTVLTLLLLSGTAFAQTNTVYFTNRFATFTNLQGKVYRHVELVTLDPFSIVYRQPNGGGRVYLTNMAPATLSQLGLATNLISEATKLEKELAQQKALSEAEEMARMRDPANWRDVHVLAVFRWWDDRLECQIREMSQHVLIRRPPIDMVNYFDQRAKLAASMISTEAERQKTGAQVQQLTAQVDASSAQIKQRQYEVDIADASTPKYVSGDMWYVDAVMLRRAQINVAQVNLKADKERLETLRSQLNSDQERMQRLQERVNELTTQLKDLDALRAKVPTIKVFVTSKRYYDFPILESTGNQQQAFEK